MLITYANFGVFGSLFVTLGDCSLFFAKFEKWAKKTPEDWRFGVVASMKQQISSFQ
ncbi:hypothetical protein MACH16_02170 [Marinomonas pontica]|uniref:Uncharacterized protein n=1 Tax=Marinomonas pontica TaxID=264739 RepID=A0ABN6WJ54_9GAMM|nr:hypothetical protein MACH16_02170 [Marinomonas pontica]